MGGRMASWRFNRSHSAGRETHPPRISTGSFGSTRWVTPEARVAFRTRRWRGSNSKLSRPDPNYGWNDRPSRTSTRGVETLYQGSICSASWHPTDPNPAGLDDDEAPGEPLPLPPHELQYGFGKARPRCRRKPKEKNTAGGLSVGIDQLAEVFVFGQQDAFLLNRQVDHGLVLCLPGQLSNGHNIVSSSTQGTDHCKVAAFVGQETHPSPP